MLVTEAVFIEVILKVIRADMMIDPLDGPEKLSIASE
jgi:hypothetical protein